MCKLVSSPCCAVEILALCVSTAFYVYKYEDWIEKADHAFIHLKMLVLVGALLSTAVAGPLSSLIAATNAAVTLASLTWIFARTHVPIAESKRSVALVCTTVHFTVATCPSWFVIAQPLAASAMVLYVAGALVWICAFPENYARSRAARLLNSLGWMHVCVGVGDLAAILVSVSQEL